MSSVFDQGPPPPCPAPFNMAAHVLTHADRLADKPALIALGDPGLTLTYAGLRDRVATAAGGLRAMGLAEGERVLFRLGNGSDFPIAYLACIWAGLVPIPASSQLTQTEITDINAQTAPALILADDGLTLPAPLPCKVVTTLPQGDAIPPIKGDPNRLAYIVFTSGTSGKARGVCHAHRAIWARRMMHDGWYALSDADRVMHAGAFNWTYTLGTGLIDPWSVGATAVIPAPGTAPGGLGGLIATHEISIFAAAPGVFRQMLKTHLPAMPALRHGLSAGEHLSDAIRQGWRDATATDLHQALGMSECSTFISSCPATPAGPGMSGYPQPGRRIAVLEDGAPVPIGAPGTLAVATSDLGLMIGYLGAPPLTGEWFETGDMAQMETDGAITYLGRADDMMNAGGFRVSPLEVEAAMGQAKSVTACAAVQVEVKADATVIALFYTGAASEQTLRAHAEQMLARYKQPRLYIQQATLPYGANGKLNRRALRVQYEAPHDGNDPA